MGRYAQAAGHDRVGVNAAPAFRETAEGILLSVKAAPRSSRSGVDGIRGGALLVRIRAAPVDGKANAELVETLAGAFGVPKRNVEIKSGASGRGKTVLVRGAAPAAAYGFLAP